MSRPARADSGHRARAATCAQVGEEDEEDEEVEEKVAGHRMIA